MWDGAVVGGVEEHIEGGGGGICYAPSMVTALPGVGLGFSPS